MCKIKQNYSNFPTCLIHTEEHNSIHVYPILVIDIAKCKKYNKYNFPTDKIMSYNISALPRHCFNHLYPKIKKVQKHLSLTDTENSSDWNVETISVTKRNPTKLYVAKFSIRLRFYGNFHTSLHGSFSWKKCIFHFNYLVNSNLIWICHEFGCTIH